MQDVIGYVAATITTLAFLPQVYKVVKTKSTNDISLVMFCLLCLGTCLWLGFGILINSGPVIGANAITLMLVLVVLGYKLKYK